MFRLDNNMPNVYVYGVATAADVLANRRTHLPTIFLVIKVLQFYTNNYCIII